MADTKSDVKIFIHRARLLEKIIERVRVEKTGPCIIVYVSTRNKWVSFREGSTTSVQYGDAFTLEVFYDDDTTDCEELRVHIKGMDVCMYHRVCDQDKDCLIMYLVPNEILARAEKVHAEVTAKCR